MSARKECAKKVPKTKKGGSSFDWEDQHPRPFYDVVEPELKHKITTQERQVNFSMFNEVSGAYEKSSRPEITYIVHDIIRNQIVKRFVDDERKANEWANKFRSIDIASIFSNETSSPAKNYYISEQEIKSSVETQNGSDIVESEETTDTTYVVKQVNNPTFNLSFGSRLEAVEWILDNDIAQNTQTPAVLEKLTFPLYKCIQTSDSKSGAHPPLYNVYRYDNGRNLNSEEYRFLVSNNKVPFRSEEDAQELVKLLTDGYTFGASYINKNGGRNLSTTKVFPTPMGRFLVASEAGYSVKKYNIFAYVSAGDVENNKTDDIKEALNQLNTAEENDVKNNLTWDADKLFLKPLPTNVTSPPPYGWWVSPIKQYYYNETSFVPKEHCKITMTNQPRQTGGNVSQKYAFHGRTYAVRSEGRKRFIVTKQFGRLSLADATKKEKARLKTAVTR